MASSNRASRTGTVAAARPRRKTRTADPRAGVTATDTSATAVAPIPDDLRREWVAEAAYYIAERRGFRGGSPDDDWCQAETEIAQLLAGPRH
jgi:hypothetical protein